jgi:hypothetical protein
MLKRSISYKDFNDVDCVDIFYFNISKPELIELEVKYEHGLTSMIQRIIEQKDHKELIKLFKELVLLAHGQKSPDGKRFIKSDQLREEFSQTAAYNALFVELATNDEAAANFLKGALPTDMVGEIDKALDSKSKVSTVPDINVVNP